MTGRPTDLTNGSCLGFLVACAHQRLGLGLLDRASQRDDRDLRRRIDADRQQSHADATADVQAAVILTEPPALVAEATVMQRRPASNANLATVRMPGQLQVDVSSNWTTVELPWTMFNTPTWGDTTGLMSLALAKLQAVVWGVSNTASNFEIYLDDIELY